MVIQLAKLKTKALRDTLAYMLAEVNADALSDKVVVTLA